MHKMSVNPTILFEGEKKVSKAWYNSKAASAVYIQLRTVNHTVATAQVFGRKVVQYGAL